jgi:molecular chaperone Hsp33
MIKKNIYGNNLKAQLIAGANDRMVHFTLADDSLRGVVVNGTRMVNEMRANHELGILETLVLGRAYLGTVLMTAGLKGADRVNLQINCEGPIKGVSVDANAFGEVRGYLKNVPIPIDKPLDSFNLAPFFGTGLLSVTRYLEKAKQPFTGRVTLRYGNIAKDMAHYCLKSEQIPTAFNLSIQFDPDGQVVGAGGLFIQTMPGADDEVVKELEDLVVGFPSLGKAFEAGNRPMVLINDEFRNYGPRVLAERRVEFMCHCGKEKVNNLLMMLPYEDLTDILENGPFPLELRCHNCSTLYSFSRDEIRYIYGLRFSDN